MTCGANRAGATAGWLLRLAGLAARCAQDNVQQIRHGEHGNNGDQVGHDQNTLATVRDVLFLGPFFRHVEVEFERIGNGQCGEDKGGCQHDGFLSIRLGGLGFGARTFAEVQRERLRNQNRGEQQHDDGERLQMAHLDFLS